MGGSAVEHLGVRAEGAAQPAGGDPHPVHRVGQVPPYRRIQLDDHPNLLTDIAEHHVPGRAPLLLPVLLPGAFTLRPALSGTFGAALARPGADLVQQRGVTVPGQLHLDLVPAGLDGPRRHLRLPRGLARPLRPHLVHRHLGERHPCGVLQDPDRARRPQPYHGGRIPVQHPRADERGQFRRRRIGQRRPHLVPHPRRDRQLQMPARVLAAGAAPQRDALGGEAMAGGVVVEGVKGFDAGFLHGGDPVDTGQIGQLRIVVDVVLAFDFSHGVRHASRLATHPGPDHPPAHGSCCMAGSGAEGGTRPTA